MCALEGSLVQSVRLSDQQLSSWIGWDVLRMFRTNCRSTNIILAGPFLFVNFLPYSLCVFAFLEVLANLVFPKLVEMLSCWFVASATAHKFHSILVSKFSRKYTYIQNNFNIPWEGFDSFQLLPERSTLLEAHFTYVARSCQNDDVR